MKSIVLALICSAGILTGCSSSAVSTAHFPHGPHKFVTAATEPGWTVVPPGERF